MPDVFTVFLNKDDDDDDDEKKKEPLSSFHMNGHTLGFMIINRLKIYLKFLTTSSSLVNSTSSKFPFFGPKTERLWIML